MRDCPKCGNRIPDGMKICPHCGKLPIRLGGRFPLYIVLTAVAVLSAVLFRPFLNGPYIGKTTDGMLWVAFAVFCLFALIFLCVVLVTWHDYSHRTVREKLSSAEVQRFVNMKKHIESNRHFYEQGESFCSVCGHKKGK